MGWEESGGRERATNLIFLFFLRGPEQQQNRRQYMKLTEWQNNGGWNRLKYRYYTYAVEFFLGCVGLAPCFR
jgi:hypothetical protein